MKKILAFAFCALFAAHAQTTNPYTTYQRETVTAMLVKQDGVPLGIPLESVVGPLKGFLAIVATEDPETEAFRVTVRFRTASGEEVTRTQVAERRRDLRWTWVWLLADVGGDPLAFKVEELKATRNIVLF